MIILAINTTQKIGEISLHINDKSESVFLTETKSFSENILVKMDEILKQNNIKINNIDCISVVCGPGSFTGTRIGISLVKGIKSVLKKIKLIELNIFEVLKQGIKKENCIITENSAVGDYYFAKIENGKITQIGADNMENLMKSNLEIFDSQEINMNNLLMQATIKKFENNCFCEMENLEPIYVKQSQAQRELKKKMANEIIITPMTNSHIKSVMQIEDECFSDEKYSKNTFENEILNNKYYVAIIKNEVVGFTGFSIVEKEAELLKIAVKDNYKQMGIGTLLINNFINKMNNINKIYLEVNEFNTAKKFYNSLNFKETGKRKDYYEKGKDAILMEWNSDN